MYFLIDNQNRLALTLTSDLAVTLTLTLPGPCSQLKLEEAQISEILTVAGEHSPPVVLWMPIEGHECPRWVHDGAGNTVHFVRASPAESPLQKRVVYSIKEHAVAHLDFTAGGPTPMVLDPEVMEEVLKVVEECGAVGECTIVMGNGGVFPTQIPANTICHFVKPAVEAWQKEVTATFYDGALRGLLDYRQFQLTEQDALPNLAYSPNSQSYP